MRSIIGWVTFIAFTGMMAYPALAAEDDGGETADGQTVGCQAGCVDASTDDRLAALFATKLTGDWGGLRSRMA